MTPTFLGPNSDLEEYKNQETKPARNKPSSKGPSNLPPSSRRSELTDMSRATHASGTAGAGIPTPNFLSYTGAVSSSNNQGNAPYIKSTQLKTRPSSGISRTQMAQKSVKPTKQAKWNTTCPFCLVKQNHKLEFEVTMSYILKAYNIEVNSKIN